MRKYLVSIAMGVLSVPALGLAAYGVAHSVSDSPAPQVIIAASSGAATPGTANQQANDVRGADDLAGHDANEAAGQDTDDVNPPPTTPGVTSTTVSHGDDGADNDAADDNGATAVPGTSEDGPGHDVGDDQGGTAAPTGSPATTARSGRDGNGSGDSGSGGSGSSGRGGGSGRH